MKKKIFATITMLLMLVSVFASVPAVLAEEAEVTGGLDFYSITVHYKDPVLVNYYSTRVKQPNLEGKTETKNVNYFVNVDAETEADKYMDGKNSMLADSLVIPAGVRSAGNFYQVSTSDGTIKTGLHYSKIPYTNAFITHIIDGSAITTTSKVNLLGITAPYDDAPYVNQNPNVEYGDDGYALAAEKDENGNNYRIDRNGYLIDTNDYIWKTSDGDRIELFIAVPALRKTGTYTGKNPDLQIVDSGEMVWVPYSDRFYVDEDSNINGKIKDVQSMGYLYMLTDEEYDAFLKDDSQTSITMHVADDTDAYSSAPKKGKTIVYAQTLRMDSTIDNDTYFDTDRVFTANDILKDNNGLIAMGTPKIGTPVIKTAVSSITVEIDAAGSQLYDNVSDDPQQKNTITLSIGATEQDATLYKKWFDDGLCTEETYNNLNAFIVGTARSITTKTDVTLTKSDYNGADGYGYSPTVKSVELDVSEEILSRIPSNAALYVSFHIEENQPSDLINDEFRNKIYSLDRSGEGTLLPYRVTLKQDNETDQKAVLRNGLITPQAAEASSDGLPTWALILIIAGAVVVVAAIVIIVVVSGKKKNKKAE